MPMEELIKNTPKKHLFITVTNWFTKLIEWVRNWDFEIKMFAIISIAMIAVFFLFNGIEKTSDSRHYLEWENEPITYTVTEGNYVCTEITEVEASETAEIRYKFQCGEIWYYHYEQKEPLAKEPESKIEIGTVVHRYLVSGIKNAATESCVTDDIAHGKTTVKDSFAGYDHSKIRKAVPGWELTHNVCVLFKALTIAVVIGTGIFGGIFYSVDYWE